MRQSQDDTAGVARAHGAVVETRAVGGLRQRAPLRARARYDAVGADARRRRAARRDAARRHHRGASFDRLGASCRGLLPAPRDDALRASRARRRLVERTAAAAVPHRPRARRGERDRRGPARALDRRRPDRRPPRRDRARLVSDARVVPREVRPLHERRSGSAAAIDAAHICARSRRCRCASCGRSCATAAGATAGAACSSRGRARATVSSSARKRCAARDPLKSRSTCARRRTRPPGCSPTCARCGGCCRASHRICACGVRQRRQLRSRRAARDAGRARAAAAAARAFSDAVRAPHRSGAARRHGARRDRPRVPAVREAQGRAVLPPRRRAGAALRARGDHRRRRDGRNCSNAICASTRRACASSRWASTHPIRCPSPSCAERPYFFYAGNHRPHKDLATLVAAWASLPD